MMHGLSKVVYWKYKKNAYNCSNGEDPDTAQKEWSTYGEFSGNRTYFDSNDKNLIYNHKRSP